MPETVRIARLAAGGDGVARLADGRTVFVPRTAPGDVVELAALRNHRRFARARLGRLLEASPARVEPRCPHYVHDECGGCQLQHVSDEAQLDAGRSVVGEAVRRIGKRDAADPEIVPAERRYDYRAKLTLHVAANGRRIGLHRYSRPDDVFDLERCHITRPELMTVWQEVRQLRHLLPSRADQLVLRLDRSGGRHLLLRTGPGEAWRGAARLHRELTARGQAVTVWWQPTGGAARAMAGSAEAFPVTAFEQVHPEMGDRVREFAIGSLGDVSRRHVWDLYAGIGETTAALAAAGASVESVELDRQAVMAAEARGPAARRHLGRVEELLGELTRPELVVTNPPRAGMDARVTAALERLGPARVTYISCDPATLARDIGRLPSYAVTRLQVFDLFPQTAHVETVAVLDRI